MAHPPSEVNPSAPVKWVPREDFKRYFDSLPPDERWTHPARSHERMIWNWEERRWWAQETAS